MAKIRKRVRRDEQQVPTSATSIAWIMRQPTFLLGVTDARAGRRYHRDYDLLWDTDGQWNYERGRMWATLAPRNLPLKRAGKVNPDAMRYFKDEII